MGTLVGAAVGFVVGWIVEGVALGIKIRKTANARRHGRGEQVTQIDPETGSQRLDLLEDERQFDTTDLERKVTVPASNRRVIEEIKKYCEDHEAKYGRFRATKHISSACLCLSSPLTVSANKEGPVEGTDSAGGEVCREVGSEVKRQTSCENIY